LLLRRVFPDNPAVKQGRSTPLDPRRTRHILWDWNGTLLDDVSACVAAINRLLRRRALPTMGIARYRATFTFPVRNYYRRLGFDLRREDWDRLAREFHAAYAQTARTARLRPGSRALLRELRRAGIPMSVLSASEQNLLRRMLRRRGIAGFFRSTAGLDNLNAASKTRLGQRLMASLGVDPRHVLLVGDTVHDFDVAQSLGCRCVLVAGGHQSEERLRACGCEVLEGLAGLAA
jgi:phosphoglycolate phosphatase